MRRRAIKPTDIKWGADWTVIAALMLLDLAGLSRRRANRWLCASHDTSTVSCGRLSWWTRTTSRMRQLQQTRSFRQLCSSPNAVSPRRAVREDQVQCTAQHGSRGRRRGCLHGRRSIFLMIAHVQRKLVLCCSMENSTTVATMEIEGAL